MATPQEIQAAAQAVQSLSSFFIPCRDVALALIETRQRWAHFGFVSKIVITEYQVAQGKVFKQLSHAQRRLRRIRRTQSSPEAIRVTAYLEKLKQTCRQCPENNRNRIREGKKFVCFLEARLKQSPIRFHLNEKGQILES